MPPTLFFLAALGYGLAALAYLVLSGLIVASWKRRSHGRRLLLATGLSVAWGALLSVSAWHQLSPLLALSVEVGRNAAWLALLFYILQVRLPERVQLPAPLRIARLVAGALVAGLLFASLFSTLLPGMPVAPPWVIHLGLVMLTVIGLVLVEQVFRSTRPEDRWAIKFMCLGLGGLFVYDFYLYANAALFNALDAEAWAARGFVAAMVAPLIAVSAARNPEWASPVGLSRSMVFHSASLLAAGIYLLLMASAGYYLRLFGGEWGTIVQTIFLFAAGLLLVLLMFSGTLRARLRVFVSKHFFSYRYDYREEWLNFTRILTGGQSSEQMCERAVEAMARLVESPGGALWLHEGEAGFQRASHWNWSDIAGTEPPQSEFVQWLADKQWVLDLDEKKTRPDLYGDLDIPRWIVDADDAWLVIPLMLHDELLGFIVLKHSLGNVGFNWEVSDLLKVAARQAAAHLAQMRASNQLIVARQFESFTRTSTFVIHDLKNLVAQLSLLLANAEKHKNNPDFQADMLDTIESAVVRMNKVLAQLRRGDSADRLQTVALADVLRDAAASKQGYKPQPDIELPASDVRVRIERERLSRAVGHLLQNALEATPAGGRVRLRGYASSGQAIIEVIDTGSGMDENFIRTRLFQPFDSTKGAGMGIGAYECRETVRALGGRVDVESTPGRGTRFTLTLPLAQAIDNEGDAA